MLRLEKTKQLERLSEDDQKVLKAEIKASRKVLKFYKEILEERINHLSSGLHTQIENPTAQRR